MIHPMWTEFAKIAFREYLKAEEEDDEDEAFADWADRMTDASAVMADRMCAEYDKRNQPAASDAPSLSVETAIRAARIKSNDGPF